MSLGIEDRLALQDLIAAYSWALDTVGLFGARADDLARGLLAMTGRTEFSGITPRSPRIGVVRQEFAGAVESAAEEGLLAAIKAAERAGASVRTIDLPGSVQEAWRIHPIVQDYEAHRALAWEFSERHDEIVRQSALQIEVVDVVRRILQIPFNRADGVGDATVERRIRERRIGDHRARCGRQVGHRHDQVLLVVGVEIPAVPAA